MCARSLSQANRTREKLVEAGIVSLLIRLSKVGVFEMTAWRIYV